MTEQSPKPLNRIEVWIAEHSAPIFVTLALLIVLAAIAVFYTFQQAGDAKRQIDVLRPQVTRVINNAVVCSLDAPRGSQESRKCAMRLRVALINCRQFPLCREALLLASKPPPPRIDAPPALPSKGSSSEGGDAFQPPSNNGHQPPGPATGPPPSPAPSPLPAPGQSEKAPSGAGVEVCALSKCVDAEVDLDPKGLLP
jgi:hypothetical protein